MADLVEGLLNLAQSSAFTDTIVPRLITSDILNNAFIGLRNGWTSDMPNITIPTTTQNPAGFNFGLLPSDSFLRVGQPISLFVSLPTVGTVLDLANVPGVPSNTPVLPADASSKKKEFVAALKAINSNGDLWRIPEGSSFVGQWKLYKKDTGDTDFVPAVAANSPDDPDGHYQLLNGTLFSAATGISRVVFWPSAKLDERRQVVACLEASGMVNDGSGNVTKANRLCYGQRIQAWTELLGPVTNNVFSQELASQAKFPSSFQDLFDITIDTNAPLAGLASTIRILPIDKSKVLAPRLDQILDHSPNLKFSAAFDLGAPLNAWINAGVKAVTGLFKPTSGARAAERISGGILDVSNVLTGALSVPFALNVQGSTVTKTLKPILGSEGLPNINQIPGLNGLSGALPIGAITAQIKSTIRNIAWTTEQTTNAKFNVELLESLHGLSVLVAPKLIAAGTKPVKNGITLDLTLRPQILLPGVKTPLLQEIKLGKITIIQPTIIVPQIALFFHHQGFISGPENNILVAIDPASYRLLSSVNQITTFLTSLVDIVSRVKDLFPDGLTSEFNKNWDVGLDGLLSTAGTILKYAQNSDNVKLDIWDFGHPGHEYYDTSADGNFDIDDNRSGVSAMIWMGVPGSLYRLEMESFEKPDHTLYWGSLASRENLFHGYLADVNTVSDSLIIKNSGIPWGRQDVKDHFDNHMTVIRFVRQSR